LAEKSNAIATLVCTAYTPAKLVKENLTMKRIEAIVRPHKVPLVLAAIARHGITNVTVLEVLGLARQISFSRVWEPASPNPETATGLIPKRLIVLFLRDNEVQSVVDLIRSIAFTGEPGDGKIAISPLDDVVRIRPKETAK